MVTTSSHILDCSSLSPALPFAKFANGICIQPGYLTIFFFLGI